MRSERGGSEDYRENGIRSHTEFVNHGKNFEFYSEREAAKTVAH